MFGSLGGLITFDPTAIVDDTYVPPVVFTDFLLANQRVPIGTNSPLAQAIDQTENIELPFDARVISFQFSALGYRAPRQHRYRYMLQGFDQQWTEVDATRRLVTYTNLDPGRYVFRVTGSNGGGEWNSVGRAVTLTVLPPWWETWWFRGITVLALLAAAAGAYFWRVNGLRAESRRLEQLVADRTHELAVSLETRDMFLRTLAHDLKGPLVGLGWHVQLLQRRAQVGTLDAQALSDALQEVVDGTAEAVSSIDELHDLTLVVAGSPVPLNRERVDLVALAKHVVRTGPLAGRNHVRVTSQTDELVVEADRARLSRILANLLDNAGKYSPATGEIIVQVSLEESNDSTYGVVRVIDQGRGIPAADLPQIFERYHRGANVDNAGGQGLGLFSVRRLVELHGGHLTVESREGHGTTVAVWLPFGS